MSIILFDIISGISGDMTIAALLNAGASFPYLQQEISRLELKGYELLVSKKMRSEIESLKFDVVITGAQNSHTGLKDILRLIDESTLSEYVKTNSKRIFNTIAKAESKIHNLPEQEIHFHEIGALDSIIDIVGTCICLESLKADKILTSPVKHGTGLIKTQHGIMPNPSPAALEILKDYPAEFTRIGFELTTPTGAAIVKTLSGGIYHNNQLFKINKIGFGSGTFDIQEMPNLLRIMICEEQFAEDEQMIIIETNIDDMNPQIYPYVMEKLFEAGANDVFYQQIIMKKGRPGIMISVLTEEKLAEKMSGILYKETTTIGLRISRVDRHKLYREIKEFSSSFGVVKAKQIYNGTSLVKIIPEFEECKRIAQATSKPVNEIYNALIRELNI